MLLVLPTATRCIYVAKTGILNDFLSIFRYSTVKTKMTHWELEKEKFLSLTIEKKRDLYARNRYVQVNQIPTWKQYAKEHTSLPAKIPLKSEYQIDNSKNNVLAEKVSIFRGDITTLEVDSIVNAANKTLMGGGGVDGAIHSAAGSNLKEECRTLNGCNVGEAKLTGGYKLPAKYVIHTVGPQGEKPSDLANCYRNSLEVMKRKNFSTIAFPCISTGIYGYPLEPAAHVACYQVRQHLEKNFSDVNRVIFCLFSEDDEGIYQSIMQSYFPLE